MNDIISDLQDMRYLNWTRTRKSSGTAGSFLKAYDDSGKKKKILKNIKMIPKDYLNILPELNTKDIKKIFEGLDTVIGAEYISKMNEMIKKRWCSLDNI